MRLTVCLIIIGLLPLSAFSQDKYEKKSERFVKTLEKDFKLTPRQKEDLKKIHKETAKTIDDLANDFGTKNSGSNSDKSVDKLVDETVKDVEDIVDPKPKPKSKTTGPKKTPPKVNKKPTPQPPPPKTALKPSSSKKTS